jgi:uncharacterized protein YceK
MRCSPLLLVVLIAIAVSGCGTASTAGVSASKARVFPARVHVITDRCPAARSVAATNRSEGVRNGVVAPSGTLQTLVCGAVGRPTHFEGGPFNHALDEAKPLPADKVCATNAVSPTVLLLTYRNPNLDRRVVLDMAGCPSVLLSPTKSLGLTDAGIQLVDRLLSGPHPGRVT